MESGKGIDITSKDMPTIEVGNVGSLTEADVRRIVRQEIKSCKIEDLDKRVKYLETCGGPSGR